jgi:hypothetical protein
MGGSAGFDHLVYAVPDLACAVADIGRRAGVRPVEGGPHPGLGTRNFLLGLSGASYLEIIGPDLEQPSLAQPRPFGIDDLRTPKLVGWAVATDDLDGAITRARAAGHDPGPARDMSRRRPDGELLRWRLTPPRAGLLPFLIDWGATTHPAGSLPVLPLRSFEAVHPDPETVRAGLAALGTELTVRPGERPTLIARLDGPITLQ